MRYVYCVALVLCATPYESYGQATHYIEEQGLALGTTYTIKAHITKQNTSTLKKQVTHILERIDTMMSTYRSDSILSQFNTSTSSEWFAVPKELAYVVQESLRISKATHGVFDITVAPLVRVWGFGPQAQKQRPSQATLDTLRKHTGYRLIQVKEDLTALRKKHPQTQCDLSAIAKGYAVDQVAEYLSLLNIQNYLIEIGGEIKAKGVNPNGQIWAIGIRSPENKSAVEKVVFLKNKAIATSGHYNNYFIDTKGSTKAQAIYSHVIDPRTGRAGVLNTNEYTASVSVIHESCMVADAFATAFLVMGAQGNGNEDTLRISHAENLAVYLVNYTTKGPQHIMSPTFQTLTQE